MRMSLADVYDDKVISRRSERNSGTWGAALDL
jgi:hypothetical protein